MKIRSLRLATRLFLAFGTIVLLSALTSGLALLKLHDIQYSLVDIVTDNEKIVLNTEMSDTIYSVARDMRTLILLDDEAAKAAERKQIDAAQATYDKSRAALDKFSSSQAEAGSKAKRAAIDAAAQKARPLNNHVIELAMLKKGAEATALLLKEAAPATQAWQVALRENVALERKDSQAQFADAQAAYASARAWLIGAAIFGALVAIGLSLAVVRRLVAELGGEPAEVAALASAIADSDLTTKITVRDGDSSSVLAGMARMQTSLAGIVNSVRGNAESVAAASAQIAQGNTDLSQRTEQQASALQQTAATMDQLGSTVRNNADNAKQANQLAQGASSVAARGGSVVGQVVLTMKGINDSSKKIADIINVIDGIAFQTNILALNAAVEAARAGEQGRGFAVVATEVRNLAQRSAAAAKEIKTLITDSVEKVDQGTSLVDQAGQTMAEIVVAIKRVSDMVAEISEASTEQSAGVNQVGQAVSQMDQVTQQNAALVEESAAAAESLKQQAVQLVQAVAVFKLNRDHAHGSAATMSSHSTSVAQVSRPGVRALAAAPKRAAPQVSAKAAAADPAPHKAASEEWETF